MIRNIVFGFIGLSALIGAVILFAFVVARLALKVVA